METATIAEAAGILAACLLILALVKPLRWLEAAFVAHVEHVTPADLVRNRNGVLVVRGGLLDQEGAR